LPHPPAWTGAVDPHLCGGGARQRWVEETMTIGRKRTAAAPFL